MFENFSEMMLELFVSSLWETIIMVGVSGLVGGLIGIPLVALKMLLRCAIQLTMLLAFGYAILSWVQPQSPVMGTLDRLCAPILRPLRRVVPLVGGVDLSVLVLIILLQVGLMLLG